MLAKLSCLVLNPKGPYLRKKKKKEEICSPMDNIHGAVRKFPDAGKRNVQKSMIRVQSCCLASFVSPYSLPLPIHKFCFHGNMTSHLSFP